MPTPRVTIAQVAAEAGVSAMTVSNVVNERPGASESTRQRVLEVARRLGYTPPGTRNGKRGRTGLIGVLTLDLTGQYSLEIVRGIAEEIADDERELFLNAALDAARERERISLFAGGLVDGLLLIAPVLAPETEQAIQAGGLPVVVIDPRRLDLDLPRVTVDNYDGVRAGTHHLIELGHRRIAYIRGEDDHESTDARHRGYTDALRLAGIQPDPALVASSNFNHQGGVHAATQLLTAQRPTAIVAGADLVALGALDAARALGLSVPDDLSIVGFDDLPQAAHSAPPLTTVRQPLHEMGRAGTRALMSLIARQPLATDDIRLATKLILRATTAPPAGG
ncbi:LacI family DNA-binding transcriptional regulator [Streptomyces canus]|uniref:LacI family DNA-binding transcriptional regulator n=1 Tax=Streptomyces canus TaxID=58343 RepID=UPI00074677EE|nr:LacI family DNA-binding transcriptional regulator [Streptomyces canus]KUN00370.1 LacI family transcriptional regulator [Streptomyces canus]